MNALASTGHWPTPKKGAKFAVNFLLARMNEEDDYPLLDEESVGDDAEPSRIKTSVRLMKELDDELEFIADLWNAFDKLRPGKKRKKKWKKSSVMELFIQAGRDRWAKRMGDMPAPEDRKEYLRQARLRFDEMVAREKAERAARLKSSK